MTEKVSRTNTPDLLHSTNSTIRNWPITWIVLVVGLIITINATMYMKSSVEIIANAEFTSNCNEIKNNIINRLDEHARILLSGAALFNASETVSRENWRVFNKVQKIEKQLPGIQGIGFSLLIPRAELTRHIQKTRREGFPQYKLRPDGVREVYSSIIYIEPFSGRNLRAFGYDMFSEPVRRSAMERARDTDTAALSGKVVLVQETDKEVQAGSLMYVPVYRKRMPIETIEQRRAAIYGWVYSPYRMNDLMQEIIGNRNLGKEKQLHFQVFDGTQPSIQSLLYDSQPTGDETLRPDARFTLQIPVDFNGRRWTLRFTQTGGGLATVDYISAWLTLVSGIFISLLLFSLTRGLLSTRAKAHIAANLAAEQRETKEYLEKLIDYANVPIVVWNQQFQIIRFNHAFESLTGRVFGDVLGNKLEMLFPPDLADSLMEHIKRTLSSEHWKSLEISILHVSGSVSTVLWNSATIFAGDGITPVATIAQGTDITERKQAENGLQRSERQLTDIIAFLPDATLTINKEKRVIIWNKAIEEMTGVSAAEMIGKGDYAYSIPFYGDARPQLMDLVFEDNEEIAAKYPQIKRDGDTITTEAFCNALYNNKGAWVLAKASPLHDQSGNIIGAIESIRDITERKRAEENIKTSLHEKETLLREIHHRVKNNLQIISSLLNLQTRYVIDEKMEGIFRECQDRITAMASVHALLYKSQNLTEIDFGEYMRETAKYLFRSYKSSNAIISMVVQAGNVLLPIDRAIPCGLIINELLTNALKHAFPKDRNGEIKIEMNRTAIGINLLFEDNGIGFPKTADFYQSETFGLKLVHLLVKQLDGSIEQVIDGGTKYTIMFKTTTQQEA